MTRFSETARERERAFVCERERGSREKKVCAYTRKHTHTHSLRERRGREREIVNM